MLQQTTPMTGTERGREEPKATPERPRIERGREEPKATPERIDNPALSGLWVLLVQNEGELAVEDADGRVPVMARAGNDQTYLLAFKNVAKARQFVAAQELDGAEPRMVVRGNRDDIVRIAKSVGVVGTLIDYDPATQKYAAAGALA